MHVRINIPAWGAREVTSGVLALAGGGERTRRLRDSLERVAPGWKIVPLASARYGIALAVRTLGLSGRRIAVPAYVCPAVLTGLRAASAEPVALDTAPSSLRYDAEALTRAVAQGDVDAVLAPNTYGADQDFELLATLGLPVIEDAAYQAGTTDYRGRPCGTRGDAGVWSFNFKALTAVGGGVLLVRGDRSAPEPCASSGGAGEVLRFVNYALRGLARHRIPGFLPGASRPSLEAPSEARLALTVLREGRMSELQASVALAQWETRESLFERQRANTACLDDAVSGCQALETLVPAGGAALPHLYPVLVRAELARARETVFRFRMHLHERGLQTEEPYPVLLGTPQEFPNAHALAERLMLLPCNASLGPRQLVRLAAAIGGIAQQEADTAGLHIGATRGNHSEPQRER